MTTFENRDVFEYALRVSNLHRRTKLKVTDIAATIIAYR